jgi:hypothetical protein
MRFPGRGEVIVLEPVGKLHAIRGDAWGTLDGWFEWTDLGRVVAGGVERAIDDDALEGLTAERGVNDLTKYDVAIDRYGIGEGEKGGAAGIDGNADVAGSGFRVRRRHDGAIIRTKVLLWGEVRGKNFGCSRLAAVTPECLATSFLDAGGSTGEATEVVEAGAADATLAGDLDGLKSRAVEGKGALNADAGGDAANGKVGGSTFPDTDDSALEGLKTFTSALDHTDLDADGVASAKVWEVGFGGLREFAEVNYHGHLTVLNESCFMRRRHFSGGRGVASSGGMRGITELHQVPSILEI